MIAYTLYIVRIEGRAAQLVRASSPIRAALCAINTENMSLGRIYSNLPEVSLLDLIDVQEQTGK